MSIRRATDPVYLQFIWNAIESCSRNSVDSSFHELLTFIQRECDSKCSPCKLQNELSNAICDGCIVCTQRNYLKCDLPIPKDKHDWYCFECHGPGQMVSCPTCFRVYHSECISNATETSVSLRLSQDDDFTTDISTNGLSPNHPCASCQRLSQPIKYNGVEPSSTELHKIFLCILDRIKNKVSWKTMQIVGYLNEPQRNNYLVYRQMNTRTIADRMRAVPNSKDGYSSSASLMADLDLLVHNTTIFYGAKTDMSNMARQIRLQIKREIRESTFCIDCYLRSQSTSTVSRLTAPCRKPHRLLWFQHNGWSFRPCKMLHENSDGYEVICFGGRRERVFVPIARAVDMGFTALELGLRMTPPLKKALDEAEEYKANQAAFDRQINSNSNNNLKKSDLLTVPGGMSFTSDVNSKLDTSNKTLSSLSSPRKRKSDGSSTVQSFTNIEKSNLTNSREFLDNKKSKKKLKPARSLAYSNGSLSVTSDKYDQSSNGETFKGRSLTSLSSLDSDADCNPFPQISNRNTKDDVLNSKTKTVNPSPKSVKKKRKSNRDNSTSHVSHLFAADPSPSPSEFSTCLSNDTDLRRTIRIKPLPLRTDTELNDRHYHHHRSKPIPSSSSASSAISSSSATVPAIASSSSGVGPTSDSFSASSSTESHISSKLRRGAKSRRHSSKVEQVHDCPPTSPVDCCSIRYDSIVKRDQNGSKLTFKKSSKSGDQLFSQCAIPSSPSDSDSLSSMSSTVSSASTSPLSSSSLSSSSTLPSPNRRRVPMAKSMSQSEMVIQSRAAADAISTNKLDDDDDDDDDDGGGGGGGRRIKMPTSTSFDSAASLVKRGVCRSDTNMLKSAVSGEVAPSLFVADYHETGSKQANQSNSSIGNLNNRENCSSLTTNSTLKATYRSHPTPSFELGYVKLNSALGSGSTNWSGQATSVSISNAAHLTHIPGSIEPIASNASAASSCYSSVSPAALSSTSGLGSSMSDPKSVDASPGEVATMLGGNTSFSCPSGSGSAHLHGDTNMMLKTEDRIHRIYADRLIALTTERDQAREEVHRRDMQIVELKRFYETEIKRVKQRTWCQLCLNEAFYHCCPGTAYCSENCQLQHWTMQHNRDCRRRTEAQHNHHQQQQQQQTTT